MICICKLYIKLFIEYTFFINVVTFQITILDDHFVYNIAIIYNKAITLYMNIIHAVKKVVIFGN